MKKVGIYRSFDGKQYEWVDRVITRAEAEKVKGKLKKAGYNVRITKTGYGNYEIWERK